MLASGPPLHAAVHLLADHLDAALAAGEDLLSSRLPAAADLAAAPDAGELELARFVSRLMRLEAALVGRILQARRRIEDLPKHDAALKPIAQLFVANTALLLDILERFAARPGARFETGNDRLAFLRDRGLLARDAAGLPLYEPLTVSESFRVGAALELGPLMDLVAALLDLLDRRYELYGADDRSDQVAAADAPRLSSPAAAREAAEDAIPSPDPDPRG